VNHWDFDWIRCYTEAASTESRPPMIAPINAEAVESTIVPLVCALIELSHHEPSGAINAPARP